MGVSPRIGSLGGVLKNGLSGVILALKRIGRGL